MGFEQTVDAYKRQIQAELDDLLAAGLQIQGSFPAHLLIIKAELNQEEKHGAPLLSQEDGEALHKALAALSYRPDQICVLSAVHVTEQAHIQEIPHELLKLAVESIDPAAIILCDKLAQSSFVQAYQLQEAFEAGQLKLIFGRRVLYLDGFEQSLASQQAKQLMWKHLKQLKAEGEAY